MREWGLTRRAGTHASPVGITISLSLARSLARSLSHMGEADLASLLLCSLSALQPLLHSCHALNAFGHGVVIGSGIVGFCAASCV
jgi:hypothetical protein